VTHSRAVRCLVVVLALVVAGCGKSAVEEFADDLRPFEEELTQQKARVGSTLGDVRLGNRADARAVRRQVAGVARIQSEMSKLEHPGEVDEQFETFVKATREQVGALQRVVTALQSGDRARLRQASERAQISEGAVRRAADVLHDRLNEG
jgi:hypothetical protein